MKFKKLYRDLKLDYDLFLWVKNVNSTNAVIYKDEQNLLKNFKKNVLKRQRKRKDNDIVKDANLRLTKLKEYKLQSPKWQPQSPSI
jgi:hypothetical protein